VYGCLNCHGDRLQGLKIHDEPAFARIVAPNLTRAVREYSDAELERVIRRGVRRTGISNWVMPSAMYSRMSDEDLRNVIAFLRSSSSVQDGPAADITMGPLGRIGIVTGKFKPVVSQIPPGLRPAVTTVRGDPLAFGEYLVKTACSECHGQDLKGDEFLKAPALTVLAGYSDEAFRHLMKTGRGLGDRKLGLMTQAGAARFPHLTDDELEAMSLFLKQQFGGLAKAGESSATAARTERRGPDRS
jgi:mono/diheme cytochrome c family protein